MPQQPSNGWTPVDESTSAPQGWTPVDAQPESWLHKTFAPRQVPQSKPTGEMPGSFEGHPENIGEYVPATAGEILGGGKDVVHGDIAKGMHRIISGAGNAVAPLVLPFAAAAAPAATATTLASGALAQQIGKRGSQALGANEDQSDLAGDITGLAGGYGGSKVPSGRLAKVIGKVGKGTLEDIPGVRQAGKLAQYWNETAPPPTYPGAPLPEAPPAEVTQARSLATGAKPAVDPAAGLSKVKSGALAEAMKDPGAPLPEKPAPQLLQGNALLKGPQPMVDPAAGLGSIKQPGQAGQLAEAMQKPQPAEVAPGFQRGHLQKLLNESVGAKQLDPKVSLRQQMPARSAPPTEAPADLPQGHTAHESSAVPSSMYDSGANEFHARMVSGNTTYVYGDVAPEEAQAFADAPSKGKAFQQIKNGHPLVAKIVDGKRISVKAANPAP